MMLQHNQFLCQKGYITSLKGVRFLSFVIICKIRNGIIDINISKQLFDDTRVRAKFKKLYAALLCMFPKKLIGIKTENVEARPCQCS